MAFERQVFSKGDRVAVGHGAGVYAVETVLRTDALGATVGQNELGTITGCTNPEKTYYTVKLDSGEERECTFEEIVKVADA